MSFDNWWQKAHRHPESEPIHHGIGLAVLRQDKVPLTREQVEIAEGMVRLEILARGEEPWTYQLVVSHACGAEPVSPQTSPRIDTAEPSWSSLYRERSRNTRRSSRLRSVTQLGFEFHDWTAPKAEPRSAAVAPNPQP